MIKLNKIISAAVLTTAFTVPSISMAASVLYQESFNGGAAKFNHSSAHWRSGAKNIEVTYDVRRTTINGSTRTGSANPMNGTFDIAENAIDATIKYRVNLRDGFPDMGGKFFGLGPEAPITGCKDITTDGWSARVVIRDHKPQLYIYDQSKPDGKCGARLEGTQTLTDGQWHDIALYVKLNSSGSASDGKAILYVDGVESIRRENIQFFGGSSSNVPVKSKIQKVIRTTFLGGPFSDPSGANSTPVLTAKALFDNFKVERGNKP